MQKKPSALFRLSLKAKWHSGISFLISGNKKKSLKASSGELTRLGYHLHFSSSRTSYVICIETLTLISILTFWEHISASPLSRDFLNWPRVVLVVTRRSWRSPSWHLINANFKFAGDGKTTMALLKNWVFRFSKIMKLCHLPKSSRRTRTCQKFRSFKLLNNKEHWSFILLRASKLKIWFICRQFYLSAPQSVMH